MTCDTAGKSGQKGRRRSTMHNDAETIGKRCPEMSMNQSDLLIFISSNLAISP
jgi:hypothetical protein